MRVRAAGVAVVTGVLLLTACGSTAPSAPPRPPVRRAADAPRLLPVPRGDGSDVPDDFDGDGHRDLVLNDLVKRQSHADDAGIGIVYGGGPRGLVPGARQLITPGGQGARTAGQLPAVLDAEASCDLDGDGFTDLVVSTDPPYDGQGRPPVPLQLLFGSPQGLTGRAVRLVVPARARAGNDWPDRPVCGDFDGDGAHDLVVHASGEQLSFLRGPFTRKGDPKAAGAPIAAPGNVPVGPAADVDRDGYDDLVVRTAEGAGPAAVVLGGPAGPARTGVTLPAGVDVALARFGRGPALDAAVGAARETALRYDLPAPAGATPPASATLPAPGALLDTADLDGDGLGELISGGSALRVFHGRTRGLPAAGPVTVTPPAAGTTRVLATGDFDGDGRDDLVVRSHRGDTEDTVALYPGARTGLLARTPAVTFSTSAFLAR
ncbi:VCBS repeat-containing protein [Streptomyces sp. JB150]|uniref:FG-GAP repeat domain-containing protein n=1 Tax=Streptomyces sp. JB150 TaxID=2714844 RepID=UPI00140D37C4|nr:VCBS repeat-containing protein [Streptomyces sp. JB150]QIJ63783.1 VCBS repeat-containing protein [Streptomyces sp. JB150]